MILRIVPKGGIGRVRPLVIDVSQFVAYQENGTPVAAGLVFGPDGACRVSVAGQDDFQRTLRAAGVDTQVAVDRLRLPGPPPGARLLAGPRD